MKVFILFIVPIVWLFGRSFNKINNMTNQNFKKENDKTITINV